MTNLALPVLAKAKPLKSVLRGLGKKLALSLSRVNALRPSIFNFQSSDQFFRAIVDYLRTKEGFSNRRFAKQLGLKSHSLIPMIYYGQRKLSFEMVNRLSQACNFSHNERIYLENLVHKEHTSKQHQGSPVKIHSSDFNHSPISGLAQRNKESRLFAGIWNIRVKPERYPELIQALRTQLSNLSSQFRSRDEGVDLVQISVQCLINVENGD